jgi:hypothetical protein
MLGRHFACALACLGLSGAAHAHGGKWSADQILVEPGNAAHMILRADAWGLAETHDAGASWQWVCPEAYGRKSLDVERVGMALLRGGDLLVAGAFDGVLRSRGGLCDFGPVAFFDDKALCGGKACVFQDVSRSSARTLVVANWAGASGVRSGLWGSSDEGGSWAALPDTLPSDVVVSSALGSPSSPARIYATGARLPDQSAFVLLASDDAGATWRETLIPYDSSLLQPGDPGPVLRPYGVAPADPGTVFLWADFADASPQRKGPDRALVSTDGGVTLQEVFDGHDNLEAFALSPDGKTVMLGSYADGLWSAAVADLRTKGKQAFHQVNTMSTFGLLWSADGLIAGHDDFGAPPAPRFSLGISHDLGVTFTPTMTVCGLTLLSCAAGTASGDRCPGQWSGNNFVHDFVTPRCPATTGAPDATGPVANPPTDAGPVRGSAPPARDPGCGVCSVVEMPRRRTGDERPLGVSAVLGLALLGRRRSARARARRRLAR